MGGPLFCRAILFIWPNDIGCIEIMRENQIALWQYRETPSPKHYRQGKAMHIEVRRGNWLGLGLPNPNCFT